MNYFNEDSPFEYFFIQKEHVFYSALFKKPQIHCSALMHF
jgi:hypothetical protein